MSTVLNEISTSKLVACGLRVNQSGLERPQVIHMAQNICAGFLVSLPRIIWEPSNRFQLLFQNSLHKPTWIFNLSIVFGRNFQRWQIGLEGMRLRTSWANMKLLARTMLTRPGEFDVIKVHGMEPGVLFLVMLLQRRCIHPSWSKLLSFTASLFNSRYLALIENYTLITICFSNQVSCKYFMILGLNAMNRYPFYKIVIGLMYHSMDGLRLGSTHYLHHIH